MEIAGETIEIQCSCGAVHEVGLSAQLFDAHGEIQTTTQREFDAMGVEQ